MINLYHKRENVQSWIKQITDEVLYVINGSHEDDIFFFNIDDFQSNLVQSRYIPNIDIDISNPEIEYVNDKQGVLKLKFSGFFDVLIFKHTKSCDNLEVNKKGDYLIHTFNASMNKLEIQERINLIKEMQVDLSKGIDSHNISIDKYIEDAVNTKKHELEILRNSKNSKLETLKNKSLKMTQQLNKPTDD